jgi:Ca-activated chloride channel family protein
MSSLRGSPPACSSTSGRSVRVADTVRVAALSALLAGCSSAAGLDEAQGGGSGTDGFGDVTGAATGSASQADSAGGNGTEEPTGWGSTTGADETGPLSSSGTGEEPSPPPSDEPSPSDEKDPQNVPEADLCVADKTTAWRLAVRDADAMSSPAHAREAMLGPWPSLIGVEVRPWEFLNYYTFAYPLAPPGQLLAGAQLRASQDDLGDMFELQVAVRGPELTETERPSLHLTLALDNSGSMAGKALELLKSASHVLASQLRVGDSVAVVSWDQLDSVLLPPMMVSGPDDAKLLKAIDEFTVGGAAELTQALSAAYAAADQQYVPKDINRVVFISDGGATATPDDLLQLAQRATDEPLKTGIHAIAVGVGDPALYRDDLINAIGLAGAGPSVYVGSPEAAENQLGKRFLGLVGLTASSVDVRVTLPPGLQLEAVASAPVEVVGQDHVTAGPNDRVVLHRRLRPCLADLDHDGAIVVEIAWTDALTGEPKQASAEWKLTELLSGETGWVAKGEAVLAYAEALRAIQYHAGDTEAIDTAWAQLKAAKTALPDDQELAEIEQMLAALQEP